MPRRRCSKKKGKHMCTKCDRFYSSSQSLYYHCYQKHRGINNNNIEIDGDIINHNVLSDEEDDDFESIGPWPVNVKLSEQNINLLEVKVEPINEVKVEPINEVEQQPVKEVKPQYVKEVKLKPIISEEQNSILKDTLELINKCISKNIDINLKIKINNKTIEIKSD